MGASTWTAQRRQGEADEAVPALAAFRAGDGRALQTLIEAFGSMMRAVARRYVRGHDVDDAVQDAWVAFTTSASAIRDPAALGGWLRVTTTNAALRIAKRQARAVPTDLSTTGSSVPDEAEHPFDDGDRRVVREAVNRLEPPHRELLTLMFDAELSYEEIAARTGRPVGWIGPTRRRAIDRLRRDGAIRRLAVAV